jgi:hypothetical protein
MNNLTFNIDNRIIRDLYNTKEEAINASKSLGCDGYRVYVINNETKYVPCNSFIEYENSLRYRVVQGKIGVFGSDTFGSKLVGLQFAGPRNEIQGDPFFTLGNFSISKSINLNQDTNEVVNQANSTGGTLLEKSYNARQIVESGGDFDSSDYLSALNRRIESNLSVKLLFDKRKLENYVLFSSLKERMKNVMIEIFNNYPAALKIDPISILLPSVSNYTPYPNENRSEIKINLYAIKNPFNIEFTRTGLNIADSETISKYRNFSKTINEYVILFNGIEYPIINAILPTSSEDQEIGLRLIIDGTPFSNLISENGSGNFEFYVKPKEKIYREFFENLSDLAGFLLLKEENTNKFKSDFVYPITNDVGKIVTIKNTLYFPMVDEINIDMSTNQFDTYLKDLNDLSDSFDSAKTNLISRFLVTESFKEFDTDERKINMLLQLYGSTFDEIKKYIDGITFMRNVSYDKIENVPDLLIKNYATMLGMDVFNIEDENTLINSLFEIKENISGTSALPAEIDIEIWRRILINSFYLYKSKGTRKSIDFILKLAGLPEDIFEISEYVYLADRPVNSIEKLNNIYSTNSPDDPQTLIDRVPFDFNGFPTVPFNIAFQESGGFIREDKKNIGPFDFGDRYINTYKKFEGVFLFDLYRTKDNIKSWVYHDSNKILFKDNNSNYTEYESNHSNLAVNSKELDVYLASNKIFEISVYRQYLRNIGFVNSELNFPGSFRVSNISFNRFISTCLNSSINPKNRKTIKTYPSLSKIYFDYLKLTSNVIDYSKSLEFLSRFDSSWVKLIENFIPATSIFRAGNKIQNSVFLDNKFQYKTGKNKNYLWTGTDGSEFQNKALAPVYAGTTNLVSNKAEYIDSVKTEIKPFDIKGNLGNKLLGKDSTLNEYFGFYYTMLDYCDNSLGKFYLWREGIDYSDEIYGGNINESDYTIANRFGVFVIYNGLLYRLATNFLFSDTDDIPEIHTFGPGSTIESRYPPNKATVSNLDDVTRKIWEPIPIDTDSLSVKFSDTKDEPIKDEERSFYINSISKALAFVAMGVDFDCPPPKPHVCYFDYEGLDIEISYETNYNYVDELGNFNTIKQPRYYGYSKNYNTLRPSRETIGKPQNWVSNYVKRFNWVESEVYFKDEIIAKPDSINKDKLEPSSPIFKVIDTFVIGTNQYPDETFDGLELIAYAEPTGDNGANVDKTTITDGIIGGMFESYQDRVKTDPFMHIDPAYISKINLNPNQSVYSINLTKSIGLNHIFKGETPDTTFVVNDNLIDGNLFISDSVSLNFEGFYPIAENSVGPFYNLNDSETFVHTLIDKAELIADIDNYISIQSLNESFIRDGLDISLVNSNPGYYLITNSSFLNFTFNLYFESNQSTSQTVNIKLINSLGFVYTQNNYTFNGDDSAELRQFSFDYSGFFKSGDKVYLAIRPINLPCTLSRYELIDYIHTEPLENSYNMLNDPRFRVLFNSGFSTKSEILDGLSIKPIYNNIDLEVTDLKLRVNPNVYNNVPLINLIHSSNLDLFYNKLFSQFINKDQLETPRYNTVILDKELNYDKIDFSFKVRSKNPSIALIANSSLDGIQSVKVGVLAPQLEYLVNFDDYKLGKSIVQTEHNDVSNQISIGKSNVRRSFIFNREFTYSPKYSFYRGSELSEEIENIYGNFISLSDGIGDYTFFDYSQSIIGQININKRFNSGVLGTNTYNSYKLENDVYNTEIYRKLLDTVPEFNSQIINYNLNDIVKITINDYKLVVDTDGTYSVQTTSVQRLYVCVNDITDDHVYKITNSQNQLVSGEIHEIYRPRGSRSCFVEIEKYLPANFTPWGYDENSLQTTNNNNIYDYINKEIKPYDPEILNDYQFGDIILGPVDGTDELMRFVYPKPLNWDPEKQYFKGDYVLLEVTEIVSGTPTIFYRFFIARRDNINQNPVAASPTSPTVYWRRIVNPSDLFNHKSLIGLTGWVDSINSSWLSLDKFTAYSNAVVKLPRTLPVDSNGVPYISTGVTFSNRWNNILKTDYCFVDKSFQSFETYDVSSVNKILKSVDFEGGIYYGSDMYAIEKLPFDDYSNSVFYEKGSLVKDGNLIYEKISDALAGTLTSSITDWNISYKSLFISNSLYNTDNYLDYFNQSRFEKTNILLKPSVPIGGDLYGSVYVSPFVTEGNGTYPLFERFCRLSEKNNPGRFNPEETTGITYDKLSKYLGYKYAVNRGVLYRFIGETPINTYSLQPYEDNENWVESDFCLVNNFKFYKDRTRITVTESIIESLTDTVRQNLFFYTPELVLKEGFTNRSFNGETINNRLLVALDKFYDATDLNRINLFNTGRVDFRFLNNDIIMDYYPSTDEIGFPVTGEFLGRLEIKNPCGHSANTFFGVLFDTDITLLDRRLGIDSNIIIPNQNIEVLPYVVRVVINQTGFANATVSTKLVDTNSNEISSSDNVGREKVYNSKFNIIPQTDFSILVSFNSSQNQTKFKSAFLDSINLDISKTPVNNNLVDAKVYKESNTTYVEIKLKNLNANRTIVVNLEGVVSSASNNNNNSLSFSSGAININSSLL